MQRANLGLDFPGLTAQSPILHRYNLATHLSNTRLAADLPRPALFFQRSTLSMAGSHRWRGRSLAISPDFSPQRPQRAQRRTENQRSTRVGGAMRLGSLGTRRLSPSAAP